MEEKEREEKVEKEEKVEVAGVKMMGKDLTLA